MPYVPPLALATSWHSKPSSFQTIGIGRNGPSDASVRRGGGARRRAEVISGTIMAVLVLERHKRFRQTLGTNLDHVLISNNPRGYV
eukprot:1409047-Prymnesium_polylepis.1